MKLTPRDLVADVVRDLHVLGQRLLELGRHVLSSLWLVDKATAPVSLYTPLMGAGLLVAAGGGGDAIAAVMVARMLGMGERRLHVATFSWDRLLVDPLPGPRGREGFTGLRPVGGYTFHV